MENCPLRFSSTGQVHSDSVSDVKSRFWQTGNPSVCQPEVICPKPRRVTSVSLDVLNRFGPKSKGSLPVPGVIPGLEFLDAILCKDDLESEASNQTGVLCGSPPVRTNNPVVRDTEFVKLALPASPLGICQGMKPPRHDKGSPTCSPPMGGSPKIRIEGFACGSPESGWIVQAIA